MRKPRPIGPLSSLTADQKQRLREWCDSFTYEQIQARIALPAPEGFGLSVSVWQLRRYFQRLSLDSLDHPGAGSDAPSISSIIDQAALGQDQFTPATLHLLEKRAFELTLAGEDPATISQILGLVLKSRDIATRERLTEVQRRKLALRRDLLAKHSSPRITSEQPDSSTICNSQFSIINPQSAPPPDPKPSPQATALPSAFPFPAEPSSSSIPA